MRQWNKGVYENILDAVKDTEETIRQQEIILEQDPSPQNYSQLGCLQERLRATLHIESVFWHQKPRIKWLKERDVNSKFFHVMVKSKMLKMYTYRIKNDMGM